MDQMISISLNIDGENFMNCNYIQLEPYAPNSGRKFVFSGVRTNAELVTHNCVITVSVTVQNRKFKYVDLIQFDLIVLNFYDLSNSECCVYGHPVNLETIEYRQGIVDVFNDWQKGILFDWFSQPMDSILKLDYISACMIYSGLPIKIVDKDEFPLDLSLIKEERDFYYLASLELLGDRGYFGHDFHTFRDCLLEIYNHNGFFYDKKIKFINSIHPQNDKLSDLFEKIRAKFVDFKFSID